jgi:hypothetical protein
MITFYTLCYMFVSVFSGKRFLCFFGLEFFFLYCFFKTEFLVTGTVPEFTQTVLYVTDLNGLTNYRLT